MNDCKGEKRYGMKVQMSKKWVAHAPKQKIIIFGQNNMLNLKPCESEN